MCSVASGSEHLFLLGSACANDENELHIVQYLEDANKIQTRQVFKIGQPVRQLSASPYEESHTIVATNDLVSFLQLDSESRSVKSKLQT